MTKKKKPATAPIETNLDAVAAAIDAGKVLIGEGKTKAEAAMAIYTLIEAESQETIVKAFVEGATLTEKGALTYWYNCRRKMKKLRFIQTAQDSKSNAGP